MKQSRKNQSGFGIILILLIAAVIVGLTVTGFLVYRHNKNTAVTTSTSQKSTTNTQQNVYANWKIYCDNFYHYCFKYPQDWVLSSNAATKVGDIAGASLLNPAKTTSVSYGIPDTHDRGLLAFFVASIDKLTLANQDLTVVGGYIPTSGDNGLAGNNVPSYQVVDSSLLNTYPLTIGQTTKFPTNPDFTVKNFQALGSFKIRPAITINTISDSLSWLNSTDAKTGLLILKSFYYNSTP